MLGPKAITVLRRRFCICPVGELTTARARTVSRPHVPLTARKSLISPSEHANPPRPGPLRNRVRAR